MSVTARIIFYPCQVCGFMNVIQRNIRSADLQLIHESTDRYVVRLSPYLRSWHHPIHPALHAKIIFPPQVPSNNHTLFLESKKKRRHKLKVDLGVTCVPRGEKQHGVSTLHALFISQCPVPERNAWRRMGNRHFIHPWKFRECTFFRGQHVFSSNGLSRVLTRGVGCMTWCNSRDHVLDDLTAVAESRSVIRRRWCGKVSPPIAPRLEEHVAGWSFGESRRDKTGTRALAGKA